MVRLAIIGGSGAGKSTLARRLGAALAVPVHHIDMMYWQNGWVVRDQQALAALATAALEQEHWVFDGFPGRFWHSHGDNLDTLIFLDVPYFTRFWRVITRSFKNGRHRGPDNAGNLAGLFRRKFIYNWLFGWHLKAHWRCKRLLDSAPQNVRRVHLPNAQAIEKYMAEITLKRRAQNRNKPD